MSDQPAALLTALSIEQRRILALAAVFQSAKLVHLLATQGIAALTVHGAAYDYLVSESLSERPLKQRFARVADLRIGLESLERCLVQPYQSLPHTKQRRKSQILQYASGLLAIERKLARRAVWDTQIDKQLPVLRHRLGFFSGDLRHSAVLAGLATLYLETAGGLTLRLQVQGQPRELTHPANIDRIRACLLTGLQAAHTWQALGGRRWRLILGRRQMMLSLRELALLDQPMHINAS